MGPVGGPRDVRVDARRRVLRSVCWTFVDELHEIPISVAIIVLEGVGALLRLELLEIRVD